MVITKIEAQKKKGRYNIYLNDAFNGAFSFSISENFSSISLNGLFLFK